MIPWSSSQSPICVLAIGRLQRGQLVIAGLSHLLGDLVLDAHQDAQGLWGELGLGHHRELVPHVADALAQVGNRACRGRRRIVELMGQACGDGAERQQLLALTDDLAVAACHRPCVPRSNGTPSETPTA